MSDGGGTNVTELQRSWKPLKGVGLELGQLVVFLCIQDTQGKEQVCRLVQPWFYIETHTTHT